MKNFRILLAVIAFVFGLIMIFTVSGTRAIYLGSLCMIICIAFLYYARQSEKKSEQIEQTEPEKPAEPAEQQE